MDLHLQNKSSINECLRMSLGKGYYVYAYGTKQNRYAHYVGKGLKLRALDHLKGGSDDKGYSLNQLFIFAQNIPTEDEAFAIEAVLRKQHKPRDNIVAGKHEDRIVMTKFAEIFAKHEKEQVNLIVDDDPAWFVKWKQECGKTASFSKLFKDKIRLESRITGKGDKNTPSLYLALDIAPDGALIKFKIHSTLAEGKTGKYRDGFKIWLKAFGISNAVNEGLENKSSEDIWNIPCDNMKVDLAIDMWKDIFGVE